jgi:hypothetical protein
MQPVLHCILSSIKNVIRENETRNDEAPTAILKIKRGKSEIKMEKLLFVNVAEGNLVIKYCLIYLSSISNYIFISMLNTKWLYYPSYCSSNSFEFQYWIFIFNFLILRKIFLEIENEK